MLDIQIRRLSVKEEIEPFIKFFQAMLTEMTSFGGHPLQDANSLLSSLRYPIQEDVQSPDCLLLVAELNSPESQLIGILEANIANLYPIFLPKSSLHIRAVYVTPKFRRRGIALSLFEEAFAWGRVKGCTEVDLNVLLSSPAKVLYESLGFEAFEIEMRRKL
ncbi:hypothetical protein NIES2101_42450 [Calothrix sp. HK-06]|nr:hypothetical protein NIES2101_42450 [Calothrix sp. HK-06]